MKERALSGLFNHCTAEVLRMCWLKRDIWKAGIALAGMLLFLVLMVGIPVSAVGAQKEASALGEPGTVMAQATSTEDAAVTELNKEKLAQEVQQLKNQNEPTFFDWLRSNVSILLLGLGAFAGFLRYLAERRDSQKRLLEDRQAEREKRAEERFQAVVVGLGSKDVEARTVAAIVLRTFLQPSYRILEEQSAQLGPESLDASHIQLDNAFLIQSNLEHVWMREAFLRGARLYHAKLSGAYLRKADLSGAYLNGADLTKANLTGASLNKTRLKGVNLRGLTSGEQISARQGSREQDSREQGSAWLTSVGLICVRPTLKMLYHWKILTYVESRD
jgi:hypothetical protein